MRVLVFLLFIFFSKNIFALSVNDIKLYKEIFNDYRNGDFKNGEKNIAKLEDLILMGHVEALKLLHPSKHRSSFLELKTWLELYNDQYEANRIYKLALKRMPSDAKKPKKTIVDGMRDGLSNASKGAAIIPQPIPNTLWAVDAM